MSFTKFFCFGFYSVLDPKISFSEQEGHEGAAIDGVFEGSSAMLTPYDMKRLESYANSLVDYHLVGYL
jgi:N-acetyltransferase 10